jgi:hypothetical protein
MTNLVNCILAITLSITICYGQRVNDKYIKKFPFAVTLKPFVGAKTNELKIEDNLGSGKINYRVAIAPRVGLGVSYKWFNISSSFFRVGEIDKSKKGLTQEFDLQWNLYLRFINADVRIQRYEGYFLNNSSDILNWEANRGLFYQRNDLVTASIGGNIRYNFNFRKYSTKAIFSQTERQLRSAGSPEIGIRWNLLFVESDSSIVPNNLKNKLSDFNLNQMAFSDIGIGAGYSYTFVLGKWFFNAGAMGFILAQSVSFIGDEIAHEQTGFQVNFQSRGAIGYTNDNFYFGLNVVADQMYSNWQKQKDILYTFSKTKLIYAKRIHTRPLKKDELSIWDQF